MRIIHMIGVHALMKWYKFDPYNYGPGAFVLMAAAFFAASYVITFILRKIPTLNLL